ncbi:MAG TPA: cyclic nucleotide-binding domain-containing protein [Gammaproteobacteria bacterium]|nr:cyclic nucleotide-binding domain-containing protein [Gammaproteobacteria bacterium]
MPVPATVHLYDLLDEPLRQWLEQAGRRHRFPAGHTILEEGEKGHNMYFLLAGECEVDIQGEVVNRIRSGELFGELGGLGEGRRTSTVRSSGPVEVLEISRQSILHVMEQSPAAASALLKSLATTARAISGREADVRREHRALRDVERELLPDTAVMVDSRRFSMEYRWQPLTWASGDYCDVIRLGAERYLLCIGDVVGHGAQTSVSMATLRSGLRTLLSVDTRPAGLLSRLDRHLLRNGPRNMPVTLVIALIEGSRDATVACFSTAGCHGPLLYRDGAVASFGKTHGPLLGYGFGEDYDYGETCIPLRTADRLMLFTDGLSEARKGPARDDMLTVPGLARLLGKVCANCKEGALEHLFLAIDGFRLGYDAGDDATAMLVTVH